MTKPSSDEVRHRQAVWAANKIYMTADQHVIIFSRALYPVFDADGQVCWECLAGAQSVHVRLRLQRRWCQLWLG